MKNLLTTTALAVILISPAVMAGERTVTVPTPKSITLICSDDVEKGTVVLTNPPKFSCADYETIKSVVGTGISIGPDTRIQEISRAIARANHKEKRKSRIASVTHKGNTSTYKMKSGNIVTWREPVQKTPVRKNTNVRIREDLWKRKFEPIPQPTFRSDSSFGTTPSEESFYRALLHTDEKSQWKTVDPDLYNRFDGFSRNKKFFRD